MESSFRGAGILVVVVVVVVVMIVGGCGAIAFFFFKMGVDLDEVVMAKAVEEAAVAAASEDVALWYRKQCDIGISHFVFSDAIMHFYIYKRSCLLVCPFHVIFECQKLRILPLIDVINNVTMSDDEIIASYGLPRSLFQNE